MEKQICGCPLEILPCPLACFFPTEKCSTKARESVAKKRRRQTIFSWEEDSAELGGKVAIDVCQTLVVSNIFYFRPYLGKISNLTNIFQMGWNHQLEKNQFHIHKNASQFLMEVVNSLQFKETRIIYPPSNVLRMISRGFLVWPERQASQISLRSNEVQWYRFCWFVWLSLAGSGFGFTNLFRQSG